MTTATAASRVTTAPKRRAYRNVDRSPSPSPSVVVVVGLGRWRIRCHRATETISAPATRKQPARVCGKVTRATLLVRTATMSVSSARPVSGLIR
ncbi:hypothetical protein GCM10027605_36710 [Micromonospora zhanjiangensis]